MDDANGDRKVKEAVSIVMVHFFFEGQFLGFSGSSGPLKVTCVVLLEFHHFLAPESSRDLPRKDPWVSWDRPDHLDLHQARPDLRLAFPLPVAA